MKEERLEEIKRTWSGKSPRMSEGERADWAWEDIPELLDEIDRLRERVGRLEETATKVLAVYARDRGVKGYALEDLNSALNEEPQNEDTSA